MGENKNEQTNNDTKQADELEAQLKRALADYANLKNRFEKEKEHSIKFAQEALMLQLISMLDAIEMTAREFRNLLQSHGLERVDVNPGDTFDPEFMEAVDTEPGGDTIVDVYAPAYKLHHRIVRAAQVKIGKKQNETE